MSFGSPVPQPRKISEQDIRDALDRMVAKNGGRPIGSPVVKGPYRTRDINTQPDQ